MMELFEYRNVVIESPNSPEAEAYRKLELNIRMSNIDKPLRVIQSTSATPQDGKTTTAINLAAVYAEKGKKVIILDFDLRRPKIQRAFHKSNDIGLYDFVVNDKDVHDLIIRDESGIDLLLTGHKLSYPHIVLQSNKVIEMVNQLKNEYDYIVVDTPPVLSVTDALVVSKFVDGVIYVAAYNQTRKDNAKAGLEQLKENNANIIGAVLANIDVRKSQGSYGYYYYSNYDTKE
ncbi:MAG TPA: CpsD/CapB family tyrosine-protein kinase [Bacillota bacterium]|nr:CpsD/CapB family tyrosine-protein kinase [Bacillota bacterium]HPJ24446.1 CpsD/CapB family tyrosine-protein kinase [Bacillota bacterium]